jgi:hypothetical protein
MRAVRDWKYWTRYVTGATPMMIMRQLWRVLWTFAIYMSPKYRWLRKDISQGTL